MTSPRAFLVVLVTICAAAAVGLVVGGRKPSAETRAVPREHLLSMAPSSPELPTYTPGSAWASLPPPPAPPEPHITESTSASEAVVAEEAPYVQQETYGSEESYVAPEGSEESGGGVPRGRPHGISGGEAGCAC